MRRLVVLAFSIVAVVACSAPSVASAESVRVYEACVPGSCGFQVTLDKSGQWSSSSCGCWLGSSSGTLTKMKEPHFKYFSFLVTSGPYPGCESRLKKLGKNYGGPEWPGSPCPEIEGSVSLTFLYNVRR